MIYIKSFKNYEEFKVLFGVVEHGNGVKSRKNKILLACLKDRKLLHWWLSFKDSCDRKHRSHLYEKCDYLRATSMDDLKYFAKKMMNRIVYNDVCGMASPYYCIDFGDLSFTFYSSSMRLDGFKGICADGDSKAVRYENVEREKVFKMKAGKFITKCIEECRITRDYMPEQLKRWIGEEFAREWQVFAEQRCTDRYTLHVDDNFKDIYDSGRCYGDFGSCMTDKGQHTFYRDAIEAKAAYITDEHGWIVARCIVYTDVIDENGNHYRLAERQYSMGQDNVLKQILVDKLIKAGEIDGYKRVGVDCHDNKNFVRNDGSSMRDLVLHIACRLEAGNTLSYQDSFIYYNHDEQISFNDSSKSYSDELNTTDRQFGGGGNWSDYYGEYIPEEESVYDDYYEDWMWDNQPPYPEARESLSTTIVLRIATIGIGQTTRTLICITTIAAMSIVLTIGVSLTIVSTTSTTIGSSKRTVSILTITRSTSPRNEPCGATLPTHGSTPRKMPCALCVRSGTRATPRISILRSRMNTIVPRSAWKRMKRSSDESMLCLL